MQKRITILAILLAASLSVAAASAPPTNQRQNGAKQPPAAQERKDRYDDALPAGALKRFGTLRFRQDATSIAYSSDGKLLASGGRDNVIRLFDATTGREVRRLLGHKARSYSPPADGRGALDALFSATGTGGVNSVAFSPDGRVLASGGWDDTIRLWDVGTGKELRKIDAHKAMVGRVVFSPDGRILASRGGLDGTVRLWDPVTGTQLGRFVGLSNINPWRFNHDLALAISPDSKTVAATARNALVFYDIASGTERKRQASHVYGITVAYSPDGKLLATGGVDPGKDVYSLRILDATTGKELRKCQLPKNEPPTYLSWDPNKNGKLAAVVAEDDMHIFDTNTGKEVHRLGHYWPSRVVYSPNGKTLASAGSGPVIRHWDAETGKERFLEYDGHQAGVRSVALTRDGKLAASGGEQVRIWDIATGKTRHRINVSAASVSFSPNGKTLASAGRDRLVHLWDVETGKPMGAFEGHKNPLCAVVYSPDGKLLASGDVQSTVRIWNTEGKELHTIDNKSGTESLSLAFSPDSKTLSCAGAWNDSSFLPRPGTVIKFNGKEIKLGGSFKIQGVELTRKEGYFVLLWDTATGKEVRRFAGLTDKIKSVAFSTNGKVLAASSRDGRVCLWQADTGKLRLVILAHPGHVDSPFNATPAIGFSPDDRTLISASTDGTLRTWDARTAQELKQFRAGDGGFTALAVGRDGKTVFTGSTDTAILLHDLTLPAPAPGKKNHVITIR
jgi:WD40 repeat protein